MYKLAVVFCVFTIGCGGESASDPDSGADSNTSPAIDAGVAADAVSVDAAPFARDHYLGIDVSSAQGESFEDALAVASASGMDFITLPLNWRDIEPGPDDTFRFTSLDLNKWERDAASGQLEIDNGALRWQETGSGADLARVYTSYRLASQQMSVATTATLASVSLDGTELTLLARFHDDVSDAGGNTCAAAADDYVAVVMLASGGSPSLAMATCTDGVFATPATAVAPAAVLDLRIRRTSTEVIVEYKEPTDIAYTQLGAVAATPFAAKVRPYLYFGNPASGTVDISVDDFTVTGTAEWDDPADRFSSDPAFDILGVVELVYGALPIKIALSLRTINTVAVEIPSDLDQVSGTTGRVSFDTAEMKSRFKAFVDHVFSRIPSVDLLSVSVGNEIDGYLGSNATAWAQYSAFVNDVVVHVRSAHPTASPLTVGVKATYHGILDHGAEIGALNANSDVVMMTYYPLKGDFTVEDPSVVGPDMTAAITALASNGLGDKPIYLLEAGYPTAGPSSYCANCNSSEAKQASFVRNLFSAWEANADKIQAVNFNWLTDVSQATVDEWKLYYGVDVPAFLEYLRTLGYRQADGTAKQGWTAILSEAHARGWVAR